MTSVNVTTVRNTVEVVEGAVTTVRIITAGPQGPAGGGGGGGATDLSWDAATHTVASSTGTDAVLTEATTTLPGLMSAADKALVNYAATVTVAVRNNSGVTIPKGAAVYVTGSSGTTITVALADASLEATAAETLGLAQASISNNANGTVIAVGELTGLDTSALAEGAIIWLSETTGGLTTTRPTQPAHGVVIGYCIKSGPGTSGIVYCKVDNGLELEELHDVLVVSPTTGQVLRRASDGLWKNAQLAYSDLSGTPTLGTSAALNVGTTAGTVAAGNDSRFAADLSYTASTRLLASSTGTDVTLPLFTSTDAGLVGGSGGGTSNFLRADGTWAAPAGGVSSVSGTAPIVSSGGSTPAISISAATTSAAGSMSAADKTKLDGIAAGAQVNVATDLTYTASTRLLESSTGTDVTLPLVTSTTAGLAPLSGGGTTNFLRADGSWAAPAGGGGVTDGDKGDITVSASGATWTVDNDAITYAKIQNVTTNRLLGRSTAGSGDTEEITPGSNVILSAGTLNVYAHTAFVSGNWVSPAVGTVTTGAALIAGTAYFSPFVLPRSVTVNSLGARITTAGTAGSGSSRVQFAIYASSSTGEPSGAPLGNTVDITASTATAVEGALVSNVNLTAGVLYWFGVISDHGATPTAQTQPIFQALAGGNLYNDFIIGDPTLANVTQSGTNTHWFRTLANTFSNGWPTISSTPGTTTFAGSGNNRMPLIYIKISALL